MRVSGVLSAAVFFHLYNSAESTTINKLTGVVDSTIEDTRVLRGVDFTMLDSDKSEERGLIRQINGFVRNSEAVKPISGMSQAEAQQLLVRLSKLQSFVDLKSHIDNGRTTALVELFNAFQKEYGSSKAIELLQQAGFSKKKANDVNLWYRDHAEHPYIT